MGKHYVQDKWDNWTGGEIIDGILLYYSYGLTYNLTSNVSLSTYRSNELTFGIRLFNLDNEGPIQDKKC